MVIIMITVISLGCKARLGLPTRRILPRMQGQDSAVGGGERRPGQGFRHALQNRSTAKIQNHEEQSISSLYFRLLRGKHQWVDARGGRER